MNNNQVIGNNIVDTAYANKQLIEQQFKGIAEDAEKRKNLDSLMKNFQMGDISNLANNINQNLANNNKNFYQPRANINYSTNKNLMNSLSDFLMNAMKTGSGVASNVMSSPFAPLVSGLAGGVGSTAINYLANRKSINNLQNLQDTLSSPEIMQNEIGKIFARMSNRGAVGMSYTNPAIIREIADAYLKNIQGIAVTQAQLAGARASILGT